MTRRDSRQPKLGTVELDRAFTALNTATEANGGTTACRLADAWTEETQSPLVTLGLVAECRACPVMSECAAVAALLPKMSKAHTVMAGVRYDGLGNPVDLRRAVARDRALRDAARQRRLDQLADAAEAAARDVEPDEVPRADAAA